MSGTIATATASDDAASRLNEPDIVVGGREQLLHLLAEASEVEHTLMCSYLYAAFSLKASGEGLTPPEAAAVERWRKSIMAVATDEMAHLLLVSNLTIAVGGRPHLSRPNFPVAPGYFPSGVVVRLTPFSLETLDHFVFLERPRGVEVPDGEGFEAEREYARETPYQGVMPALQDYRTIGRLYDAIRANLSDLAHRVGEEKLFVAVVDDLRSALRAIDEIVEQGEGSSADRADSHYAAFRAMRAEFASLSSARASFAPAFPAATNPVMRRPPEPQDKVHIEGRVATRVLDLANGVYGLLLRCLVQAFGRSGDSGRRAMKRSLGIAIALMHVLDALGRTLASLPANDDDPAVNAGMTFTMLRAVDPMFAGAAEQQIVEERIDELAAAARIVSRVHPPLRGLVATLEDLRSLQRE